MPFSNITNRFARIWQFIDQFAAGENADREDFDVALNDVRDSMNAAIAYLEGLAGGGTATDLRYLGRTDTPPATRSGGGALVAGDFYVTVTAPTIFVWTGAAYETTAEIPRLNAAVQDFLDSTSQSEMRGALALGTAATQNVGAFATAAQGAKADAALTVEAGGTSIEVTDWNNLQTLPSNFYRGLVTAANSPGNTSALHGFWSRSDANNGIFIGAWVAGTIWYRPLTAGTWGAWEKAPRRQPAATDINSLGDGWWSQNVTDATPNVPSGYGMFTGALHHIGTTNERSQQLVIISSSVSGKAGTVLRRAYTGGSWGAWADSLTSAFASGATGQPINQWEWHPYNAATIGDGATGVIWDSAVNGTVASITTPDFADGYEYRLKFAEVKHGSGVQQQVFLNLYRETAAAYAGAANVFGNIATSEYLDGVVEFLRPRIAAFIHFLVQHGSSNGRSNGSLGGSTFSGLQLQHAVSQKILKAQVSITGSFTAGQVVLERRRVIT